MNSVIICFPSKGVGQEKRINTKCTYKRRGRSGEGGGNQKAASHAVFARSNAGGYLKRVMAIN